MGITRLRLFFFFQAEDGIRDYKVTGVQTCALPIFLKSRLFLESMAPAPTSEPSAGTMALKFSAWRPLGAMRKFVVTFSMSRSWPVFRPVSAEMVDILDPRSKPASFALKRPTVPVVISLLVGPAISRLA